MIRPGLGWRRAAAFYTRYTDWRYAISLPEIRVYPDLPALAQAAADHLIEQAGKAILRQGYFAILLSGGSTPQAMYSYLSQPEVSARIDWMNVHLFWGDERCVHPSHADSNYHMVYDMLISHISIPEKNIHRIHAEGQPARAAADYEREVRHFFQQRQDRVTGTDLFDLVLLGLGEDGHVASLFPGSPALLEKEHWCVMVEHNQPPPPLVRRVTATLPLINTARQVTFLVSGEKKSERVREVIYPETNRSLPAQLVQPGSDRLLWLLDSQAALKLPSPGS